MTSEMDLAVRLVLAMMRSASTDKIPPMKWWDRAKSALETGASANDFPSMVSTMARKLEIDVTHVDTGRMLAELTDLVEVDWEAFRRTCERQAVYAVAMAQAVRAEEREADERIKAERQKERA